MTGERDRFPEHFTFSQRYGHVSDEQGIRHSLLD